MAIFNSLGSNYNFSFVLKTLCTKYLLPSKEDVELKNILESKYQGKAILLYKGREAIQLALESLNLEKGSFVAINGFTCFAVYKAIADTNLKVSYLDIERGGINFSPETFEKALEKNNLIKVVIIQNTLGFPCNIEKIAKICKDKKIILIEDLAHSIGAKYENDAEAGTVGDMAILSFSQDKMVDAISGGALIIRNEKITPNFQTLDIPLKQKIIDRLYPLFTYKIRLTYPFLIGKLLHFILKKLDLLSKPMATLSGKYHNLSKFYCKIAKDEFKTLDKNIAHRRKIAEIYAKNLNSKITLPYIVKNIPISSNLRFPVFVPKREKLIKFLKEKNIYISDIWYDSPIAPKKYLQLTDYNNSCINSEKISLSVLNLPTHKNVSIKDAIIISKFINTWLSR